MATPKASTAPSSAAASPVKSGVLPGQDLPDFSTWDDVQIGFAPYYHPTKGSAMMAEIVGKDSRDPKFVRYQFRALADTLCRRGPANDDESEGAVGEEVIVKAGDVFSMSVYFSLCDEFDLHLWASAETGQRLPVRIEALNKVKTKNDRTVWNFKMKVPPEVTKILQPMRDQWRALKSGAATTRPELQG